MQKLLFLLKVSRPRFWFYTFGPYLLGLVAGVTTHGELVNPFYILFAIYFLLPANLFIYGVNDIFDYETDRLNEKKTSYEALVTPEKRRFLWLAIAVTNIPFLVLSVLGNVPAAIASTGFAFFSFFYSASPVRAKTKPFLDSAFNVLYIMPGAFGYALATSQFPPVKVIIAGACWTAAMHAYSAIPDIDADRDASLKTIATVCGANITLIICTALYLASAIVAAEYLGFLSVSLGAAYVLLMLASFRSVRTGTLFKLYRAFPLINIVAGFLIFWQVANQ